MTLMLTKHPRSSFFARNIDIMLVVCFERFNNEMSGELCAEEWSHSQLSFLTALATVVHIYNHDNNDVATKPPPFLSCGLLCLCISIYISLSASAGCAECDSININQLNPACEVLIHILTCILSVSCASAAAFDFAFRTPDDRITWGKM